MTTSVKRPRKWGIWALFLSFPTLICCAIPIILVSLGMGSTVASIYGDKLPFLQWFGSNKIAMFTISGIVLVVSYWLLFRPGRTCPLDPELARICQNAHYWNVRLLIAATVIWLVSMFSSFGLIYFL